MSDNGKRAGAAGAGGLGVLAFLRLCSHEGGEVGVAARALRGVEHGVASEGQVLSRGARGAGRLAGGGVAAREGAALRGLGVVADDGAGIGSHAFDILSNLADLPLDLDDDEPSSPPDDGALLERAFRHGEPLAKSPGLAAAWPTARREQVSARAASRSMFSVFYETSRRVGMPPRMISLAPQTGAELERISGAVPTAAEVAAVEAGARTAGELGVLREASREGLWRAIASSTAGAVVFIAGWSRGEGHRIALRDGTYVHQGDLHAACAKAIVACYVLRRIGVHGADTTPAMLQAAKKTTTSRQATARDILQAMLDERAERAASAAPGASTVSLTALVASGGMIFAVRSDEAT